MKSAFPPSTTVSGPSTETIMARSLMVVVAVAVPSRAGVMLVPPAKYISGSESVRLNVSSVSSRLSAVMGTKISQSEFRRRISSMVGVVEAPGTGISSLPETAM